MTPQVEPWSECWKFRAVDDRFKQILVEKRLWFSAPEHFNDPFDCQVDIDQTFSAIRSQLRNHLDSEFAPMVISVESHIRATRYAYLCMCKIWHQTLMWSHYGENHRGAALGFTFGRSSPFTASGLTCKEIIYKASALKDQLLRVNDALGLSRQFPPGAPGLMWAEGLQLRSEFRDSFMRLYEIVRFMKAECWSYEEEVRFETTIDDPTNRGVGKNFSPQDLKHILFGACCPHDKVNEVKALLSEPEWEHVQYWKCKCDYVNLVLNAEQIT